MQTRIGGEELSAGIDFSSCGTQSFSRNPDGTISYSDVEIGEVVFRKTYTYTAGKLTGVSKWVKQ